MPVVLPFITGQWPPLSTSERETLAAWVAMTVMVMEYFDPGTAIISQEHRSSLMTEGMPPGGWFVGVAPYYGKRLDQALWHAARAVYPEGSDPPPMADIPECRMAQATSFALGGTLFHAASVNDTQVVDFEDLERGDHGGRIGLRTVWPPVRPTLPLGSIFDDRNVPDLMANYGAVEIVAHVPDQAVRRSPIRTAGQA